MTFEFQLWFLSSDSDIFTLFLFVEYRFGIGDIFGDRRHLLLENVTLFLLVEYRFGIGDQVIGVSSTLSEY